MAIDFGRAARGIATGYLTAKVADTAAQDELNREFILQAGNQYYNVDKPNFIADEKKRSANIDFISTKLSPVYANYADANNITLSDVNTRDFISSINDLSNEDKFKLESTITQRKKQRTQTFDEKNKFITDQFANLPGGPGSTNITSMFFPNEGQDIAEVGVKQGDVPTGEMKSIMQIEGTGKKFTFTNNDHRQAAADVESRFNRFFQDPERFDVYDFSSRPDLLADYDEYKAAGFMGSEAEFAFQKFMEQNLATPEFGNLEYTGGYRVFDEKVAANRAGTQSKAVPEDGKKFDTDKDFPDIQVGQETTAAAEQDTKTKIDKDPKVDKAPTGINIETNAIVKEAREAKASIMNDPNLSEDEKDRRMEALEQSFRKELEAVGADPNRYRI
jgi:hypothetical protein